MRQSNSDQTAQPGSLVSLRCVLLGVPRVQHFLGGGGGVGGGLRCADAQSCLKCADPESFVREGPTLTCFYRGVRDDPGKYNY